MKMITRLLHNKGMAARLVLTGLLVSFSWVLGAVSFALFCWGAWIYERRRDLRSGT